MVQTSTGFVAPVQVPVLNLYHFYSYNYKFDKSTCASVTQPIFKDYN